MTRMRALVLNTLLQRATAAVFMFTLLLVVACGEDEPEVDPVTVQFNAGNPATITEDGGVKNITLSLSSAAKKDGTISLTASPANSNTFATFPTEITITKGSTSAQFAVTPINNGEIDPAAKVITFTLEDPSSGFKLGTPTTHVLTITDDEGPTTANFTIASGTVAENASAGIVVAITLSPEADVAGTIEVTMTPTDAAVTTAPTATAGVITVPVAVGQETVSFTVIPVNGTEDNDDFDVAFEITNATGGVNVGTNVDYTLTVTDDDDIVPTPIADVRAMYSGTGTQDITAPLLIQGIVTSSNPQTNTNNIWVQDATGGIIVRFKDPNNNTFKRGDEVIVSLQGARFNNFSGLVQVENVENIGTVTVVDENNTLPTPETVTLAQLQTNNYQGKLVAVENVWFSDADGILTMSGTRAITNGTETVNVRTETGAPFSASLLPLGSGRVAGLAGINASVVQIIPVVFAEDVFANSPVGTIGTTGTLADFGSVDNGAESVEQSYTVQGTTLTNDIVVTASTGYQVSLTSGSGFGSSATILAANANSATTVFVKFVPISGANQVVNGNINHKSIGAATVSIPVTGTETGNVTGAGTLMIYEVYGGGGNSGAVYKNDYVVLYNGTSLAIDLSAYSIQYASSGSTADFGASNIAPLSGTIAPQGYFLIQFAAGSGNGIDLPPPNLVGNPALALSATNGKVALVLGSTAILSTDVAHGSVIDFVGFGSANAFEGTAAVGVLSNSTSAKRATFVDTNNNSVDFVVGTPNLNYL